MTERTITFEDPPVLGIDSASAVRQGLIELRDAALAQGAFGVSVLLSHAIAWMSVLEPEESGDGWQSAGWDR